MSPGRRELRAEILSRIVQSGAPGQLLLVPEQASHEMERALCAAGGDSICLKAEVLSFSRLEGRVFSLYGGVSRKTADKGGRLIAMARALEDVGSRLKLYGAARRKPEFLSRMLRMLEEFLAARIGPETLRKASGETGGQLAVKLEELSLILESYETVLATMGQDPSDRLALLAGQLQEHDYAKGRDIYILGFTDFTGVELRVLDALLEDAASLTFGLLGDGSGGGPFSMTMETVRALESLARGRGLRCAISLLPDDKTLPPSLLHLRRYLFGGAARPFDGDASALRLHRSNSPHAACLDAAGVIQRLTLEEGWRYRDIAVCCTDPDGYGPALESVFGKLGIPLYRSGSEPIRSDPVAGMLLSALDAATGGMETEDVLRFLKSGLSPLSQTESDLLENYASAWRIRGKRWGEVWDMPPGGFGAPPDKEALDALNGARVRGAGPLLRLQDGLKNASGTPGQVLALYDFLCEIRLAETLEEQAAGCESEAELQRAQSYGQMYETIAGALEQLHRVLQNTVRSPEEFAAMVAAVLSQYTIGTIPAVLDSVVVGGPEALRFSSCRALLLLGAEDGVLPACQAETGLLTEAERRRLQELGLPVAPGQSDKLDRELIAIHQVVTAPSELLSLNYCSEQPSYLFSRLLELFPALGVSADEAVPAALTYAAGPLAEFLAGSGNAALPPALLERSRALRTRAGHRLGRLSPEGVQDLYGRKFYLSASRVDQYAACRCAYFLRYGLNLKAQKEISFDAISYGTFVHAILERTARRAAGEGGFHKVSPERLEALANEEMDAYRDGALSALLTQSERFSYLFARMRREVLEVVRELGRELRASDFEPVRFELEFSAKGELPPVEIQGKTARAELSGFVDRVDLFTSGGGAWVRVVDYKTGKKALDYTDILNGMGLQMLIYLFALERHGENAFGTKLRPAGVLYVPARQPVLTERDKPSPDEAAALRRGEQKRSGLLLAEGEAFEAMEHYREQPVYMPFTVGKDGTPSGDLAGSEDFSLLRAHVERTLAAMTDELAGGAVEPNPIVRGAEWSACAWCDYAPVCHRASGEVELRPMKRTKRDEFWTRLKEDDHA